MKTLGHYLPHFRPRRGPSMFGDIGSTSWLSFSDDPDILVAQYANLKRQVPLLYLLLILTALAVFYIFFNLAPFLLIAGVSLFLVTASAIRFASWVWFSPSPEEIELDEVVAILRRTRLAVVPIVIAYLSYAFVLDQFGGPFERAGLAVCVILTAIGCIFCLMHLPQAALLVHVLTMVPYIGYHLYHGNATFILVALNAAAVTTLMIRVSHNAFEGFTELITSRAELALQRSEAERLAAENASLAMTDALTGLPNRRLFLARLAEQVKLSEQSGESFAVGVLDLDRFKPVNDIYGHAAGDQVLVEIGRRLQLLASGTVLVARLGGDEFGLVLTGSNDFARTICDKVIDCLHRPYLIDDHKFALGCSIGFACFPEAGCTASMLFDRADYALYDIKADRKGGYTFFTPDLDTRLRAETAMEAALLSADFGSELSVELQPIVCLRTARVIGVEALGRWNSAAIGAVEPARFIEVAERLNLMGSITTQLFRRSLESLAALPGDLNLSFNLSTRDIVTSATVDRLIAAITGHGVAPARITFEITETALMQDYDVAIAHLERLRKLGVSIALDDFGTGFSSLSYLDRLPIDMIKVDRSFVHNLAEPGVSKIVAAILAMCETLELGCIVEGVETAEQYHALVRLGSDKAQGFLFARPMALGALKAWLAERAAFSASLPGLRNHPALLDLHDRYGPAAKSA